MLNAQLTGTVFISSRDRQTDRQAESVISVERLANRYGLSQGETERQTDRQRLTDRYREREREREREEQMALVTEPVRIML